MTREEIEKEVSSFISDIMSVDIEDIDTNRPLWGQNGIDELDILDLQYSIDDEFGTNLYSNDEIDLLRVSLEDLYNLIEQEVNK